MMHEHRDLIQQSLDHIEATLEGEIDTASLAADAGYSLYHYCRIFQAETGMPVMRYVTLRRLLHAVFLMAGGMKRTEAALRSGFNTYAGFYKAFVRELGCTPAEYIKAGRASLPAKRILSEEDHPMITREKAAALLPLWGLEGEQVKDIYYDGSGARSENSCAVGGGYILKFTADRRKLAVSLAVSEALVREGLSAPTPLPAADGSLYAEREGLFYWLYRKLPGNPCSSKELFLEGGREKAFLIGEAVGMLDQALKEAGAAVDTADLFHDSDLLASVRDWALPSVKESLSLSGEFCRKYLDELTRLVPQLPRQVIHRDPNLGNLLSAREEGTDSVRFGFIDFELSEKNVRLYDPLYTATSVLSEAGVIGDPGRRDAWPRLLAAILSGYDRSAHLTDAEKEAVPCVLLANQIICTAFFGSQARFAALYETNCRMLKWLIREYDALRLRQD